MSNASFGYVLLYQNNAGHVVSWPEKCAGNQKMVVRAQSGLIDFFSSNALLKFKVFISYTYLFYSGEDVKDEGGSPVMTGIPSSFLKQQEPNIDFELDVKVFINSGKCVLHTKDSFKDEEMRMYVYTFSFFCINSY